MKKIVLWIGTALWCLSGQAESIPEGLSVAPVDSSGTAGQTHFLPMPEIHGYVRARYEWDTSSGYSRFQVRNARVALSGKVIPSVGYMVQADFCDQGKIKILDAYANVGVVKGLLFQAGQFLMPMGVEPVRAPFNAVFADGAYLGTLVCNPRAVGAEVAYTFTGIPLKLMGSCFNPTTISDHTGWHHGMGCSAQAILTIGQVALSGSFMSTMPYGVRTNMTDATVTWTTSRLTLEAEYIHEHYGHDAFRGVHAYSAYADYRIPVKAGIFNRLSLQVRFDGMTDHSNGCPDASGRLTLTDAARKRLTAGATLRASRKKAWADIRLNYEKVWFDHNVPAPQGEGDRLVAELAVRF